MLKTFKISNFLKQVLCATAFIVCVIPGFNLLGNLLLQCVATAFFSVLTIIFFDLIFKIKPKNVSFSLIIMVVFWILFAVYKQINIHITFSDKTFSWIHLFYYDRPGMLFIVFLVCIIYYLIKLIIKQNDSDFIKDYTEFINVTIKAFLAYYSVILFYSFFLVRKITWTCADFNLKPFDTIYFTFSRGYIDYELIILFLGNIAIFIPLGVLLSYLIKNKLLLVLSPVILSSSIEISQYFLGNGHPDIDDIILNVLGFYLGVLIKIFIDYIILKSTKGKIKSFFVTQK